MTGEITRYRIQYDIRKNQFTIELEDGRQIILNDEDIRFGPNGNKWLYIDGHSRDIR